MQKRFSAAVLAAVLLCCVLGISACHSGSSSNAASAASIPSAQVVAAQRGDISQVLTLAGQFQPYQVVDVHPKVSGYMMAGIVVSNSILIVEFSNVLHEQGMPLHQATVTACKVRLRPILMPCGTGCLPLCWSTSKQG